MRVKEVDENKGNGWMIVILPICLVFTFLNPTQLGTSILRTIFLRLLTDINGEGERGIWKQKRDVILTGCLESIGIIVMRPMFL